MIDAAATQRELNSIVQLIDAGGKEGENPLAQRLRDLAAAVVGGKYFDSWAAVEIHRLIEPDIIVEQYSRRLAKTQWVIRLQWVRNGLICLLFLFTFASIGLALNAHAALMKQHPGVAGESFLALWEHHFDGYLWQWLTPYFLFGGDFAICVVIILVVCFSTWFKHRVQVRSMLAGEQLRIRLARVLADSSLCLATGRWQGPTNLVNRFDILAHTLVQELQEERVRLSELANRREKEFADLAAFSTGVSGVTNGMLAAANALHETTANLLHGLQNFSEHFQDIPQQQQNLLATMNITIHLLHNAIDVLGGVEGRQEQRIEKMSSALASLELAVERLIETGSIQRRQIEEYTEQQHDFYQHIQAERELQNKVVQRVIYATESAGKALEEINQYANSMHIVAVDFNKVRIQLDGFLNTLKKDFFVEMKETSDQFLHSGSSLANAAANIEQASQSLSRAVTQLSNIASPFPIAGADNDNIAHVVTSKLGESLARMEDHQG